MPQNFTATWGPGRVVPRALGIQKWGAWELVSRSISPNPERLGG